MRQRRRRESCAVIAGLALQDGCDQNRHREQRGAALLLVVLLTVAAAALSAALLARAATVAREVRAREDALCARYGALSGLAFDAAITDPAAAAALVADEVRSLTAQLVTRGPSWCVLRSIASCGDATRTLERTLEDPARCN